MAIKTLESIPLEGLTTGQSILMMKSLLAYKTAMVERRKGNTSNYRTWMQRSNTLHETSPYIHNTNALQSISSVVADNYIAEAISLSKGKSSSALKSINNPVYTISENGLASLNNSTLPFDPTPEQVQ